jgi:hypothetical protein
MHSFAKLTRPDSCFFSAFKCLYGHAQAIYLTQPDGSTGFVLWIGYLYHARITRINEACHYQGSLSGHRGLCLYSSTKAQYKLSAPRMLL